MSIHLTNIKPVEKNATDWLYKANTTSPVAPGQTLNRHGQHLHLLDCQPDGNDHRVMFVTSPELESSLSVNMSGQVFNWLPEQPVMLIAEQTGISMAIHWLNWIRRLQPETVLLIEFVFLHESDSFFFRPQPSVILTPGLPSSMIAAMPLLDDWGVSSRLSCNQFQPGCFEGNLVELLEQSNMDMKAWLGFLSNQTKEQLMPLIGEPLELVEVPAAG